MEFISLTTNRYLIINADSKNHVKQKFNEIRESGEWLVWSIEKSVKTNQINNKTMTTTAEMATIPVIDQAVAEQKKVAWGDLGVKIYQEDLKLQARAQQSLGKLITPTRMEDVEKAEKALREVKAEFVAIKNDRLSITRPVDTRMSELANSEKMGDTPCKEVEQAIINLKKIDRERKEAENKRFDELSKCREWLTTMRNNQISVFKQKNLDKVEGAYKHALGDGDIDLEMVPEYIGFAMSRRSPVEFDFVYPKNTYSLVKPEEFQAMCVELLTFKPDTYLAEYENQLNEKFSDYAVALKNKAQALANAEKEKAAKESEIQAQKANANVAAKLDTVGVVIPVVSVGTKDLKKSYAVEMPETVESAITIMVAFTANIHLCMPKLNVNKWFAITPSQMAVALSKVKFDDEKFAPSGIIFKTVDKL